MDPQEYKIYQTAKAQGKDNAFIKGAIQAYRATKTSPTFTPAPPQNPAVSTANNIWNGLVNIGTGIGSAIGKTVLGVPEVALKAGAAAAGVVGAKPVQSALDTAAQGVDTAKKAIYQDPFKQELNTTSGQIGQAIGTAATYFAPALAAAKGEALVNTLSQGISSPFFSAAARVAGKAAVQGAAAGVVNLAQTGGDVKQALETAATAGAFRGATATIGEGARAINLPERLYSTIFKNSASDMMNELRTENLANLAQTDPAKYQQFIAQGIIKQSASGPVLNETVAKQALDAGLRGNIRTMARTVINGALDSEQEVQNAVRNYQEPINLGEKQFANVLTKIAQDYQDVGFNEISDEAGRLAAILKDSGGNVSATDALAIRRLLDSARIASSFEKPASALSQTQGNLKTLADAVRARLNAVGGIGEIMKKYSFYIDAMDTLAKEAARRGNNQAISLIDSLFLSSAFGGNNVIPGFTAGIGRKLLMSGPGITHLAQLLNKGIASPATIGATSAAAGGATSLLNAQ